MNEVFESISKFAKRVNLPDRLIRSMVKQGQLPHMKLGKCHTKIHIEAALENLKKYSNQNANEISMSMPVPINLVSISQPKEKKHKGRLPDKIRLGK